MLLVRCDWYSSNHIKCKSCNSITPVYEFNLNKVLECEGGCGTKFRINRLYDGDGIFEDELEILS